MHVHFYWDSLTIPVFFHLALLLQVLGGSEEVFLDGGPRTVRVILWLQDVCFLVELPLLHQFQANQEFIDFKDDAVGTIRSVPSRTLDQADIWQPRTLKAERKKKTLFKGKIKSLLHLTFLFPTNISC